MTIIKKTLFRQYVEEVVPSFKETDTEDIMDKLGEYKVRNGKMYWKPPIGLNKIVRQAIQISIRELNRLITNGIVKIDKNGEINLVKKGGSNHG